MTRRKGLALLAMVLAAPSPAVGGISFAPAASIDTAAIKVHTSAGCPAPADGFYAVAQGHGFPADGQIVTTPTAAGMSRAAGFDVYFAQTMKDFAADNHTTLAGRYDVSVFCIDSFTGNKFAEFAGSLTFTSPTAYRAAGAVSGSAPAGEPPPSDSGAAVTAPTAPALPAVPAAAPAVGGSRRTRDGLPTGWLFAGPALILAAFEGGRRFGRRSATRS